MTPTRTVHWLSALLCACALGLSEGQFFGLNQGGGSCTLYRTALRGTCQSIYDCSFVLDTYRQLPPTLCFFQGRIPYVCCPNLGSSTSDVSPPSVSFTCGTSATKPLVQEFEEAFVSKALASPAAGAFFPNSASFAHRVARSPLPQAASRLPPSLIPLLDGDRFAIIKGVDSFRNSWPWMALLGFGSRSSPEWRCAGVLINEQWVLTAAHCVIRRLAVVVRLGEHDLSRTGESPHQDFGVIDTKHHPSYTPPQVYHDLALLKLDRTVKIRNEIRPVCLPWGKTPSPPIGSVVTVTGWGETAFRGSRSNVLQEATLHMINRQECTNKFSSETNDYHSTFPKGITSDLFCIGEKDGGGQDTCNGDSGGPVVVRKGNTHILAGIVSLGYGCGKPDFPGVYASVHHSPDLAWIKSVAF